MNALIRLLYALLIAGAVAAFAGLTVYSFYQPPKPPEYPSSSYAVNQTEAEYQAEQRVRDRISDQQREKEKAYFSNVTVALLPMAGVAAAAGLYMIRRRSEVLGEGLALGGVAISIYAIITASLADSRILRFVAVTILLIIVLLVAHFRFSPPRKSTKQHLPL
ncbi:MAG TPA: hypothetical protein VD706_02730 [Candidatus Saccharimonadales bacterium]|nr:hypothetical protein [Candidatus Saccharimonadales bacterium]